MENKTVLGTFDATILELEKVTKNGRYYSKEIWDQIANDPIIKEQMNMKSFFITMYPPNADAPDEVESSHIAGAITDLRHNELRNTIEISADILNTPQGRLLVEMLDRHDPVSASVYGHVPEEEAICIDYGHEVKWPKVVNYTLDGVRLYPYQEIWDNNIENYKKE